MLLRKVSKTLLALILSATISSQALTLPAQANGALKFSAARASLSTDLAEHVKGYVITITNTSEHAIDINSFSTQDGLSGEDAYLQYKKKGTKSTAGLWAGAVLFWWLFFIPVLVAAVATPVIAIKNNKKNKASWEEAQKFTNKLEKTNLEPGESINVLTLVRLTSEPTIGITYTDRVTGEPTEELLNL